MAQDPIGQDQWADTIGERMIERNVLARLKDRATSLLPAQIWILIAIGVAALIPVLTSNNFVIRVAGNVALMALLGSGLNIVAGYSGLLDLGFVAFYGIGAYAYAYLSSSYVGDGIHLPALLTLLIAAGLGVLFGLLLGSASLRLSGDYLAIATLGFGLAFLNLMNSLTRVSLPGLEDPINLTGGTNGITSLDEMGFFGLQLSSVTDYYYLLLIVLGIALLVVYHLQQSPLGRAWRSLREDELAAEAMGMNVRWLKLQAFMIGAAIAAIAGALFAARQGSVFPGNFNTDLLIDIYAIVVLGGLGSLPGVVCGALIMMAGPELLRNTDFATLLFYGGTLIVLYITVRPRIQFAIVLAGVVLLGLVIQLVVSLFATPAYVEAGGLFSWFAVPEELITTSPVVNLIRGWLIIPQDFKIWGNIAYVVTIVLALALSRTKLVLLRTGLLVLLVYTLVTAWELRLSQEPSITRLLLVGLLLVLLMIYRPNGLLGRRRVQVV